MHLLIRTAVAAALALAATLTMAQVPVIPQPVRVELKEGAFALTPETRLVASGAAVPVAKLLQGMLSPATGFELGIASRASGNRIEFHLDSKLEKDLGTEGYRLAVKEGHVAIRAAGPAGLFYGAQSLRQLFPNQVFSKSKVSGVEWSAQACEIEDMPRFKWRGAMLDVARHFQPKEFILKFIDLMAMHKLNSLHLHLTEDQGWRIEIKRYPKLTEVGAWRKNSMKVYDPPVWTNEPHGGFYTQEELKEIVAYAAARYINVIQEIEMPGHAQAAIAAYPELGNKPHEQLEVWTRWGVNENIFNVKDSTIEFLQNVLAEVIEIFPSTFIHIGGDEAPKKQWEQSAFAQAKMKQLGLKDEHELQSWFIRQMDAWLDKRGRRLVGWSEILEGGLAPGATLMVWLGNEGAMTAVGSGHDVVMAQTTHTYFDYYQSRDRAKEPHAIGGFLPLEQVYRYNPVLPQMTPEQAGHVLGTQFQLWSEYIPNPKHMEYMAFPRACALSEVAWTPVGRKDFNEFRSRLEKHVERLKILDVNFRPLDPVGAQSSIGWRSRQIGEAWTERTWEIGALAPAAGSYDVQFQFIGGAHRLDIAWIEIWEGDNRLARVDQEGRTGGENRNNVYRVDLSGRTAGAKLTLKARVRCDGGDDSNGEIFVKKAGEEQGF